MEIIIPIDTVVKIHGNPILFKVVNKIDLTGTITYQLINIETRLHHDVAVPVADLVIISNRELYKRILEQKISTKKAIVKTLNTDVKAYKIVLGELEKFSSDETELLALIDTFKAEKPSVIQKIIKLKEHINFSKFLGEWV